MRKLFTSMPCTKGAPAGLPCAVSKKRTVVVAAWSTTASVSLDRLMVAGDRNSVRRPCAQGWLTGRPSYVYT